MTRRTTTPPSFLARACIVLFAASAAFPATANLMAADRIPPWLGRLDVAVAALLAGIAMLVAVKNRDRVKCLEEVFQHGAGDDEVRVLVIEEHTRCEQVRIVNDRVNKRTTLLGHREIGLRQLGVLFVREQIETGTVSEQLPQRRLRHGRVHRGRPLRKRVGDGRIPGHRRRIVLSQDADEHRRHRLRV
jgi:hypothetical protein